MGKLFNKIICFDYTGKELDLVSWKNIDKLCKKRVLVSENQLKKELLDADCILLKLGASFGRELINKAPKLAYIGMLGTGCGRIDIDYAKKKGIVVRNIAGYSTEGVAELTLGLILEHIREIARAKSQAQKGNYSESTFSGIEIKDKEFGIIGLGRIGGRIGEIALGFGAKVSYWSKHRKKLFEKKGIKYKSVEKILKESDFVSLNLSFTSQTEGIIDKKRVKLIKPGSIVVNTAPMELVEFNPLVKRLGKEDFTFILDHSDELSKKEAKILSKLKNCIMYPPIGYITKEATEAKQLMFVDNIKNFLNAKPSNKVN